MFQSNFQGDRSEPGDVPVEDHIDLCTHHVVSEILFLIIEDLPVFRLKNSMEDGNFMNKGNINVENEGLCGELSSDSTDIKHFKDRNILQYSKLVNDEDIMEGNDDYDLSHCEIQDSIENQQEVSSKTYGDMTNSCIKEQLLFALHLSPVCKDTSKELDVKDGNVTEKKKESVHFNSPVAVVYEFSEAVSDDSTEILSDSDYEDFQLSQTKHVDNLESQNNEVNLRIIDTEPDIDRLLNSSENSFEGCLKDCIMTPGGDCFNNRLSENIVPFEQSVEIIDKTNKDNVNDKSQSILSSPSHNFKGSEFCTKEKTEHLQKGGMESDQSGNDKVSCSPAADGDSVTLSKDMKSGDNNPDKHETKESAVDSFLLDKSVVLSSSPEGDGILSNLQTIENTCTKYDNDINEVFTKFPLVQKQHDVDSSQDLFINFEQENATEAGASYKSEKDSTKGNSQQNSFIQTHSVSCNDSSHNSETNRNEEFIGTIVELKEELIQPSQQNESQSNVNDVDVKKENKENVFCHVGKREQSSPELNSSHISKKKKSDVEDESTVQTRKRKLFKVGLDENGSVKLLRLDTNLIESGDIKVPKLLKQLASDVIATLDETVIWDSTEKQAEKQKDLYKEHDDITAQSCVTSEDTSSDTESINDDFKNLMPTDSEFVDFNLEKQEEISEDHLLSSQHAEELQLAESETKNAFDSENDQNILLLTSTSEHLNYYQDIESPQAETSDVCDASKSEAIKSPCESENDQNTSQISIKTLEHIDCYQNTEVPHTESSEVYDESQSEEHVTSGQNILKSPGFISATELLSQSSQDSASTGFTIHAEDLSCSQDSCEKNTFYNSEIRQSDTVGELLKESSLTIEKVGLFKEEFQHVYGTTQTYKTKLVVEITEDGLKEEKLEDSDIGITLSGDLKRNVELVGCSHRNATDQDEQIDTDELDMYVDNAVDQIVPDECAEKTGGTMETDREQTLDIKDKDQKPKLYACDLDLCNEQDDHSWKPINKSEKSYERCFNWKYRPSCDLDSDVHLPELPDEDHVVMITPLKTCGKPLRLGLSKRQPVKNSLHKLGIRK
ncbi:uncharacterized protein LOC123524596 [Mercenaria mercenaria]|uniref:uncharacterized protein LOC123524596 n=1 Tax=Mercenaria mercenaria TaxID=6596 RepID=UPI00234F2412|nr:uncharacterized protein LOC123524596 [Mercenaria mercenaria]